MKISSTKGVSSNKIHFVGNVMIDTLLRYRVESQGIDDSQ